MEAHRSKDWTHYNVRENNHRKLFVIENGNIIGTGRTAPYDIQGFFDDPEYHFNEVVNRAYTDFLFEKHILESLNESKRS